MVTVSTNNDGLSWVTVDSYIDKNPIYIGNLFYYARELFRDKPDLYEVITFNEKYVVIQRVEKKLFGYKRMSIPRMVRMKKFKKYAVRFE